ncbi:glycosyl hydrolase family protein [Halobacillus fulvus]|nr:glycosyl hydrolase family protein [Halobacillus fulvus]
MKKIVVVGFLLSVLIYAIASPVLAKKGNDEAEGHWTERGLFTGLHDKNSNAAVSHDEYATMINNLLGYPDSSKDSLSVAYELGYLEEDSINEKSVVKKGAAYGIFEDVLPQDYDFSVEDNKTNQPLKRKDVVHLVDSLIEEYYGEAGTFSDQVVEGNAWISQAGVTLENTVIEGDLFITAYQSESIELNNVTVEGQIFVEEKAQNQVSIIQSEHNGVVVFSLNDQPSDWSLVWSDEFMGDQIDPEKWNLDEGNWLLDEDGNPVSPGWGNNEKQYYTDSSENAYVEDGKLTIEAKKEETPVTDEFGSYDYTSAKLTTQDLFSKKYGKFEARMKLPEGQGYWPAFWMMPQDSVYGVWPTSGEIDIMEAAGNDLESIGGTIHYGEAFPNNTYQGKEYHFPEGEDYTDFHTYSVEWEPGEIRWYVDGELYQTLNNWFTKGENQADKYSFPAPFDQEFYLILNLAIGGWYGGDPDESTEFPGKMEVDYVRAYELTGRDYKTPEEPVLEQEELPEDAKQPLEDGNFIYDQDYQNPFTVVEENGQSFDPEYWNFVKLPDFGGAGDISTEDINGEIFAKTAIQNPGNALWSLQLIQNVPLVQGRTYEVSFDAKSTTDRTLMTKVSGGAERNFANYSGEETVSLTNEVQSFDYTFTLNQSTDLAGRLEFNMGAAGTEPVWIGNVRVEDITDQIEESGTKSPLPDGNLIYNGTFDQGDMSRMNYWEVSGQGVENAGVAVAERELKVEIGGDSEALEDATVKQTGIPYEQAATYELTFDARADLPRDVQVAFAGENGSIHQQSISLTDAMETYTIPFTVSEDQADGVGELIFNLGGQEIKVWVDNVRMIQTSKPVDYSEIDLYPLKNGDFANEKTSWSEYIHFDAAAGVTVEDEALKVGIENAGQEQWSVLIEQPNLNLAKDVTYTLSFDARSSMERKAEVTLENAGYYRYLSEVVTLGTDMQNYQYEWTMPADDQVSLKFLLGNVVGAHDIYLDNVVLEVKDAEQYE